MIKNFLKEKGFLANNFGFSRSSSKKEKAGRENFSKFFIYSFLIIVNQSIEIEYKFYLFAHKK